MELRAGAKSSCNNKPLFPNQPPEVREEAKQMLDYLLAKHHAKLQAKGRKTYYGILCGVAIAMAKRNLGLVMGYKEMGYKWLYRKRNRSQLRTKLGLQEHQSYDMSKRPIKGQPKLQVTYTNLDGI